MNILRETVMGRELFDYAFKEYSNRWRFKRPMPGDFFRTMEDASGVDLDWFWRGWFYTTDHVDIEIAGAKRVDFDTQNPYIEKPKQLQKRVDDGVSLSEQRNAELPKRANKFPELQDFYNEYDPLNVTEEDKKAYEKLMEGMTEEQKETLGNLPNAYIVRFRNVGGLVMPLIVQLEFEDGSTEVRRIPAEIWRRNNKEVSKMFVTEKPVARISLDPLGETADSDDANNHYPPKIESLGVPITPGFSRRGGGGKNPMQKAKKPDTPADGDKEAENPEDDQVEDGKEASAKGANADKKSEKKKDDSGNEG